jgi:hypothetical protein
VAKKQKQKILLSGPLHQEADKRKEMAALVSAVEGVLAQYGYECHPHLLKDPQIEKGKEPAAKDVKVGTISFEKLMKSVTPEQIRRLSKIRWHETEDKLIRCIAVGNLVSQQIATAVAGIFLLTEESPGSYLTIGELIRIPVPVLVLARENIFSTMLTGHHSPYLFTARFQDKQDVTKQVNEFVAKFDDFKLGSKSVRLPLGLSKRTENLAAAAGASFAEILTNALQEYVEREEEGGEGE